MPTLINKTFDELARGDAVSDERTLQEGDLKAWAAAFGEGDLPEGIGESQAAAGIVTSMLTALAGSALPGPGSLIRAAAIEIKAALPVAAVMTLRLVPSAAGSAVRTVHGILHLPGLRLEIAPARTLARGPARMAVADG